MHFTVLASIVSLASVSYAQTYTTAGGVGRFQCSRNGVPDQTLCADANIASTQITGCESSGTGVTNGGFKSDGPIPTGSTCVIDPTGVTNAYYCGVASAPCTSNANCDNGSCVNGVCAGRPGDACGSDAACTGNVYCGNSQGVLQGVCGFTKVVPQSQGVTGSGGSYCGDTTCGAGPFLCQNPGSAICNPDSGTGECFTFATASMRARSRRELSPRSRCPASHAVCPTLDGSKGFECVDTQSNLEQCGACASQGGVDCTTLPGVDAVGCVAGQCEIWACQESHVWDAATASCVLALVA